jgi:hypothetical protein
MGGNHHLLFVLFEEIRVDSTMMHFQIYASHFDAMFRFAPEWKIYGKPVASIAMSVYRQNDLILRIVYTLFRRSIPQVYS